MERTTKIVGREKILLAPGLSARGGCYMVQYRGGEGRLNREKIEREGKEEVKENDNE